MIYITSIVDNHALIFDGPVSHGRLDPKILTSSNLEDVKNSWELPLLAVKEAEWPALRQNALDALRRIESFQATSSSPQRRILDFGSGGGFFLAVAKELGWCAYGLEPLPASSVYARAKFGVQVTTDTLHHDTFPPNFFDVITAFQVFEHLPNPTENLSHLRSMLRPEGLMLIEVPNIDTWSVRVLRAQHRHFVQDHLNFFSGRTLSHLLEQQGFEVLETYYPQRRMSVHYLTTQWGGKFLKRRVVQVVTSMAQALGMWNRMLSIRVRDIVAVLARKIA